MHRTREQVSEMFKRLHRAPHAEETIEAMVDSARRELRDKFLSADVSISGANFLVADTGATCTVTNEGNAELSTTPPRVHIVTAGIEKLVPTMAHAFALLRLLVRSATGADITQYTTFHCRPKQPGDRDGPEEFHIVLVDNGRTRMLKEGLKDMLRCIRCGACMNHCVVFRQLGGHAYGGTYPGPMGAVLTPIFDGLESSREPVHSGAETPRRRSSPTFCPCTTWCWCTQGRSSPTSRTTPQRPPARGHRATRTSSPAPAAPPTSRAAWCWVGTGRNTCTS
jgi:L-lactate dehydrogenase complex protein LldF